MEIHDIPDHDIPPYLRFMRSAEPLYARQNDKEPKLESTIEIRTIIVRMHRLQDLPVPFAYWPDSWQDVWAIKELLKFYDLDTDYFDSTDYSADVIVHEKDQSKTEYLPELRWAGYNKNRLGVLVVKENDR